jgi:hypothetical protein
MKSAKEQQGTKDGVQIEKPASNSSKLLSGVSFIAKTSFAPDFE